jgi:hypothetical protein
MEELIRLRDELDEMLQQIRAQRRIRRPQDSGPHSAIDQRETRELNPAPLERSRPRGGRYACR